MVTFPAASERRIQSTMFKCVNKTRSLHAEQLKEKILFYLMSSYHHKYKAKPDVTPRLSLRFLLI